MAELRVTSTGTIKLFESDDTSSVTIASPASLGGDRTITLPDADVDLTEVNTMPIANLDIDGGTDIGANIADSDLLIIDDGAGGTNRKTAASRLKTYVGAGAGAFDIGNLDIDGGTDIGADIADSDLFIIDDGAGGTNRKTAASRLKTYIGGGGLVLLNASAVSSNTSAITIDNVFTSTYDNYMVIGDMTSNGNSNPQFHFRSTAPATITNSNYKYGFAGCKENGNAVTNAQNGNSVFEFATQLYNSNQVDPPTCWFQFFFNSPQIASHQRTFTGTYGVWKENGNIETYSGAGFLTLNTACGGLRFSMSANDINNASIRVYGLVNS